MKKIILVLCFLLVSFISFAQTTLHEQMLRVQDIYHVHFIYESTLNVNVPYKGAEIKGGAIKDVLRTLFEGHNIKYNIRKNNIILHTLPAPKVRHYALKMDSLSEVIVTGSLSSPMLTTQTGRRTFSADDIKTEFATLSSPDLIKSLQKVSGVAAGMEMVSNMYVHGGNSDENLFLIDGTPLYHTNHTLGLFSAFNTDIIREVDFYKSGFPARYSGRVSSITDVQTRDGDMNHYHGTFSIGLIDGRLQFEGPIVKGRTSFNVALRRSWLDVLTRPMFYFINRKHEPGDDHVNISYEFYDLNAKVTHRFNERNTLWASVYSGDDQMAGGNTFDNYDYNEISGSKLKWGKLNSALCWDSKLKPNLTSRIALHSSFCNSLVLFEDEESIPLPDKQKQYKYYYKESNKIKMLDLAVKADFGWTPIKNHHIRFGTSYTHHIFKPQTSYLQYNYSTSSGMDTLSVGEHFHVNSDELTLYAEDEMTLTDRITMNLGASYTAMMVKNKTYHLFDPRFAMKYQLNDWSSVKLSCTRMSQSLHQITSSLLSLPTDFWVPTTSDIRPTTSWQWAAGYYAEPLPNLSVSAEAFYKQSNNILRYRNWEGLQPPAASWMNDITIGKGRSYGLELDATYTLPRLTLSAAYTLSWSKRKFKEMFTDWFDDQFDNRHKFDISGRFKLTKKISATAAWTYHSGNKVTLPEHYGYTPILQVPHNEVPGNPIHFPSSYIYDKPNNFSLPAYHRLDLGFDFRHISKRGHEHTWNLSVYNAYCHFNSMFLDIFYNDYQYPKNVKVYSCGYIPILPSFSYTLKF